MKKTSGEHLALAEAASRRVGRAYNQVKICFLLALLGSPVVVLMVSLLGAPGYLLKFLLSFCMGAGFTVGALRWRCADATYKRAAGESARIAERFHAWFAEPEHPNLPPSRLTVRIGFALPVADETLEEQREEDATRLRLFFTESAVPAAGEIPKADLLFIYAHLREDGSLIGTEPNDLRELARISGATLTVLATENPEAHVRRAIALPDLAVNLAFTLDRHEETTGGMLFCAFFHDLFQAMLNGEELFAAWERLSPRPPLSGIPTEPRILLLAEGKTGTLFPAE